MRHIALLGSTGSIGTSTIDVLRVNRDKSKLTGIAAGGNMQLLARQIAEFSPSVVSVKNKSDALQLRAQFPDLQVGWGDEGLMDIVSHPTVDTMVSAIDGTTALEATLQSIKNHHRVCLANKETLVAAGELINQQLQNSRAELIPIDSEQSAIFQSIGHHDYDYIKKVILTASGGPFFKRDKEAFDSITVKDALKHPTWAMGTKVTIDSATLMNKALEVIEAFYLFRLAPGQIDVIIHPQSIVHSMVEFVDCSVLAQLSVPDMRLPILYSLSYPERINYNAQPLDLAKLRKLEFFDVNTDIFSSIRMAYDVLKEKKNSGAVLNAANEVAVDYFLKETIAFKDIFSVVEDIFYNETFYALQSVDDIKETIENTKNKTIDLIKRKF
ncbi:MAG: 1-deoxy-D-xylulose-5-phosphate reductoisomerase [bacterium]|nr:1-deoxy-D-xylulose-5-phosphate reductoisomerase [bacterium]